MRRGSSPGARPGAGGAFRGGPDQPGLVVAVLGASGGAGASTLAVACGLALADRGLRVVLVDGQPGGSGLDVVLGVEHLPGVRWPDLLDCEGVDGSALLAGLPWALGVAVLSHGRELRPAPGWSVLADAVAGLRAVADVVVLDLPRAGADRVGTLGADIAFVVAGTGVVELAGLAATAPRVAAHVGETFLVLRADRSGGSASAVALEVGAALDLPVLALVGEDRGVRHDLDRGRPPGRRPGPVARAVERMAQTVEEFASVRRRGMSGHESGSVCLA